ncbi:hypothetical protein [Giesbergeria anulus]|uniref:Uncharacterized protein n=1 Tax=Giesbergeria anulus TaxID=180197 RepID=A0A1H9M730_9BURK|nr:hypothetical protein [Giesbergeria anulus]SER18933.1 hypothetical protein SAMN02982919_01876 [Giesbergeria anulus]
MPNPFVANFHLEVTFGKPIALTQFERLIDDLNFPGIYFLHDGQCSENDFDPLSIKVKYIGKAIGETIFSRCQKHLYTITDRKAANGNPKTNPGKRFKEYREKIKFDPEGIYVVPGFMNHAEPYLISCAEEYLQFLYRQRHGDIPAANTKQ